MTYNSVASCAVTIVLFMKRVQTDHVKYTQWVNYGFPHNVRTYMIAINLVCTMVDSMHLIIGMYFSNHSVQVLNAV